MRITSLEAPHRSRDAYFRDSQTDDGTAFDATAVGGALRGVRSQDASVLYRHSPADLVYGVWDSHRNLRLATRFPRVYTSEVTGWKRLVGHRAAGRFDLVVSAGRKVLGGNDNWEPGDGSRGKNVSAFGHGSIPPSEAPAGGVTVQHIDRRASVGFAGLARISFGDLEMSAVRSARAVLAALALFGDRAAFGRPAVFLRSGCELVLTKETVSWVTRGGREEPFMLSVGLARDLLLHAVNAAEETGISWQADPVVLRPQAKLQRLIDEAYYSSPVEAQAD